jgi:flagellar hook-associated protein 2
VAQITSSIGLISGINTGQIIDELIAIDSEPVTLLNTEISSAQAVKTAYQDLETQLSSIQTVGNALALPQTFKSSTASSSDTSVLTATTGTDAAVGTYQFQVSRTVTTQQSISEGFADSSNALVGAGTITLEQGGGEASSETALSQLNGGAGVSRGQFRITDRSGNSATIDTSDAVTLDDVVNKINTALGISVHAAVTDHGLVLTDQTGKTTSNLIVQDLSGGTAAKDLGIVSSVASNTLTGTSINYLSTATAVSQLNDGNGIRTTTAGQNDFTVTVSDGTQINVSLAGAKTVGDLLNIINTAGGSKLKASIAPDNASIRLSDTSGGSGSFTITAQNNSQAAADLGLGAASGNTITGRDLIAGLDSVLVTSLQGGSGLALGTISITDRAGHSGTINLSGTTSFSDILNAINNNTDGVQVTASLNASGTGLQIQDSSGGSGNLVIGDVSSTTAADLGIAGTFDTSTPTVDGANLQHQYVSQNSLLSTYNAGNPVSLGQFKITNSAGATATVDLGAGTFNTLGDVIRLINAKNIGVTASINANGNGLLLTDTAGGANKLKVTDLGGTTAADLNIAGTATGTTIDGAMQKTITVTSTDTLSTLQTKINQLGFGVTASIINDGTGATPYRLSLTATNSGAAGRVLIDTGATGLNVRNLVDAQDAAVFMGGSDGNQPLLLTSSKNQLANVIKGVTINLAGASSSPVTLSVTSDPSGVVTQLQSFVTDFNSLVGKIDTDTKFDTTTNAGAVLLGDATAQQISQSMYDVLNTVVQGAGQYKTFADIGITINADASTSSPTLNFDQSKFDEAFANDPTAVQKLFTQATTGLGNVLSNAVDKLTDPVNGVITLQNQSIDTRVQGYQNRITELNAILAEKRTQLETQFANMETTLAQLQSQQSILNAFNNAKTTTTSTSGTSSSSSSSASSSTAA